MDYAIKFLRGKIHELEIEKRVWIKEGQPDIVKEINSQIYSVKEAIIILNEVYVPNGN